MKLFIRMTDEYCTFYKDFKQTAIQDYITQKYSNFKRNTKIQCTHWGHLIALTAMTLK